jgi:hypothetical protein
MINLYRITINGSKNPLAGAGWDGTYRSITCRTPTPFFVPEEETPLHEKPVYPVLRCTPGDFRSVLEIGYGKTAGI